MINVAVEYGVGPKKEGAKNKAEVKAWFLANPGETKAECARALGFSWVTVNKHVKAIQTEE